MPPLTVISPCIKPPAVWSDRIQSIDPQASSILELSTTPYLPLLEAEEEVGARLHLQEEAETQAAGLNEGEGEGSN